MFQIPESPPVAISNTLVSVFTSVTGLDLVSVLVLTGVVSVTDVTDLFPALPKDITFHDICYILQ